ncbi:hypothetical protein HPP92_023200 [Vanilla planifolia]|uniref:Uncharacterized protein n=1 Tax=Vanilla planifolia TaxID=51239 RepID=A0A835UFU4_VANPL|nr:hypothetical protein HPP92_023200 [Vanilla planifolia]
MMLRYVKGRRDARGWPSSTCNVSQVIEKPKKPHFTIGHEALVGPGPNLHTAIHVAHNKPLGFFLSAN